MSLGWIGIVRLGLVQTALGSIVVLATSTLNRVMVNELALAAAIPGALFALHYAVQITRPHWGHGSDMGGRRTPFILAGMGLLAIGGIGAAWSILLMGQSFALGLGLAILAYSLIGLGVGAAGTSLLALLATHVAADRRAAAGAIVWLMMIAGFVVTTILVGKLLDPWSPERLLAVVAGVCGIAFTLAALAVAGVERAADRQPAAARIAYRAAIAEVWADPTARGFTVFVFVSMLAYSAQDLILEPFAGHVFGMTPGQSTQLSGTQNAGVFLGMVLVGVFASGLRIGSMRLWTVLGCLGSAVALTLVTLAGLQGPGAPVGPLVFLLGFANGVFAVSAIGSMMGLAAGGQSGLRMGLWGAAQAFAFGLGGFLGAVASDLARAGFGSDAQGYGLVFLIEATVFLLSAVLAARTSLAAPIPAGALAGE